MRARFPFVMTLACVVVLFLIARPVTALAQGPGTITTVAGTGETTFGGDGGPATAAQILGPYGVAVDAAGNLYIADSGNHRIRKVAASTGVITTVAGSSGVGYAGDGGPATLGSLYNPGSVAVDAAGNLYIADSSNHRVRKVTAATGVISTVAGREGSGYGGDGGPATLAYLDNPLGVALDADGNIYVSDANNCRVRRIAGGIITTVAGNGDFAFGGDGGAATQASLCIPAGLAFDAAGNLYIADSLNGRIRKVAAGTNVITTIAGKGSASYGGDGGPATAAALNRPWGLTADNAGTVFVADYDNSRVRRISAGVITTVAGTGSANYGGDGGPATAADLAMPAGVAVDARGALLVADTFNCRVRKVLPAARARTEFTGDAKSDVLWRHVSAGDVWIWPMNGTARASEDFVRTVGDTNWEIRAAADFDANGKTEIVWRNRITGEVYLWAMNGTALASESYVHTAPTAYDIVDAGDHTGDGKADLLWRNASNGELWCWVMNGATPTEIVYLGIVDPAYVVKGSGDFNGDGMADLVWHNSATGEVWIWEGSANTTPLPFYVATVPDLGYHIEGVADFDGDGKADIVWRHTTRGEVWIWNLNGTTTPTATWVGNVPDTGYRIAGAGDYDGDGKADLLWHHATRGEVWVWLMDGATRLSETWVGTVPDTGYRIVK